jgi:catalase
MLLWIMSDRALPRSYTMMEGFGVHTFRLVNAAGEGRFVKFHWKPAKGTHALLWDESQRLAGKDPDFHRRDLFEAIENGDFPEFELGVQIVQEQDEGKFPFDLLDPTKIIPEELVPVQPLGKMVLNKNVENFFTETEQVAFCAAHVVPGIDFSNDPLLQGRLFSYTDTQLTRLGGPNFHELPINRPVCPFRNFQRDGFHRMTVDSGRVAYGRSLLGRSVAPTDGIESGAASFASYTERIDAHKIRERSASFGDHFSQAALFWKSQTAVEQDYIVEGFSFELAKCELKPVRERVLHSLACVDETLCARVAANLNMPAPALSAPVHKVDMAPSPALSMIHPEKAAVVGIRGRKVAILTADGADAASVTEFKAVLAKKMAVSVVLAPRPGPVAGLPGIEAQATPALMPSVVFDAVFVGGGAAAVTALTRCATAVHFVMEAYKHRKTIAVAKDAVDVLAAARISPSAPGVLVGQSPDAFATAMLKHRHWDRVDADQMPA